MELQWNYNTIETGTTTASEKQSEINNELKDVVTGLFKGSQDYYDLDVVSKYQQVFEMVTFMFEDYRKPFEKVMEIRLGADLTLEQQQVEAIVFCSWVSLEVMTSLSNHYIRT